MRTSALVALVLIPIVGSAQIRENVQAPEDRLSRIDTARDRAPAGDLQAKAEYVGDCGIPTGCGGWPEPDNGGDYGTTSTICRKSYCAQCGLNESRTASRCSWLYGAYGFCTCSDSNEVYTDEQGVTWPKCKSSGSCAFR
jgi:hypothetical protein